MIHPTAIIEPGARLGQDCEIGAYAIITRHAVLGDRVVVHPFCVVGGDPQYLRFDSTTPSGVRIGQGTVLREHVTVNRSIYPNQDTVVGEHCFLMASSHVAHDCVVGNHVVLANAALLAGHVTVGPYAFIGGSAAIHQNVRVGESVMVGGIARISRDLAPYTIVAERDEVSGLNLVGLRRRGFSAETLHELKAAFRAVYFGSGRIRDLAAKALSEGGYVTDEAKRFLSFFGEGKRNFARTSHRGSAAAEAED